jgi:hypothetical protein
MKDTTASEILAEAHRREKAAPGRGYDLAIADLKSAPLSITRGIRFDLVVYLEKCRQERWPRV